MLRKLLAVLVFALTMGFVNTYATAGTAVSMSNTSTSTITNNVSPQWRRWRRDDRRGRDGWRDNDRRHNRLETRTQIVRRGWTTYRETYQIRYLPNGRAITSLVGRVRIR